MIPWISSDTPQDEWVQNRDSYNTAQDLTDAIGASVSILSLGGAVLDFGKQVSIPQANNKPEPTNKYTKSTFQDRTVYQRDDLFDMDYVDPRTGLTNQELMAKGRSPIGFDGKPVNLHHLLQQEPGPMAEVPATTHQRGQTVLHGLVENGESFRNTPGLESQYNRFRNDYWIWRATQNEYHGE